MSYIAVRPTGLGDGNIVADAFNFLKTTADTTAQTLRDADDMLHPRARPAGTPMVLPDDKIFGLPKEAVALAAVGGLAFFLSRKKKS